MSIQTTAVGLATLPRVNLLPPEIEQRKRLQQVQAAVLVGVIAVVAGMGYLYYSGNQKVSDAKQSLNAANQENAHLTQTVATFTDVQATQATLNANEAMLSQAMATEVQWSGYLSDFGFLPHNTWMTQLTMNSSLSAGSLTAPSQAPAIIGSVSIQGDSLKFTDLANWLDGLAKVDKPVTNQPVLTNVYFSKAAEGFISKTKVINFNGSADLPSAALAARCTTPGSC